MWPVGSIEGVVRLLQADARRCLAAAVLAALALSASPAAAAPVEQGGMPVIVEEAPLPGGPAEILPIFVSGPGGPSPGPVPVGVVPGVPGGPGTTVGVPEPATWSLMLAGFLALGGALRHRR